MKSISWKYIAIGIGVVVLIGGAGLYWFLNGSNKSLELLVEQTGPQSTAETKAKNVFISPKGGEEWTMGNSYEINWISEGLESKLISLKYAEDSSSAADIGSTDVSSYTWKIPAGLLEGEYRISIFGKKIGSYEGGGYDYDSFLSEPIKIKSQTSGNIVVAVENSKNKVLGTNVGIAHLEGWSDPFLAVFSIKNPKEIIRTISIDDIKQFSPGPYFYVHNIIYSKETGRFSILIEDLPYTGGSMRNASWNFFAYSENDGSLKNIVNDDGGGSAVPSGIVVSPSGKKLVYTTGIRLGACGYVMHLEGIDIEMLAPFVFEGKVMSSILKDKPSAMNKEADNFSVVLATAPVYRERAHSPINSMIAGRDASFHIYDLIWEDDNTVRGTYTLTDCESRAQEIKEFRVTVSK